MKAGSMRSLGLLPMANSIGVLPLRITCVFLTVAAFRINWAGVVCEIGLVQIFGGWIHECRKKLLAQSYTHLSTICPRSVRSCRKCLYVVQSMESLHVMSMMESHVCTNCPRIHLESVHPLMKFGKTSDGEVLLHGYAVRCDVAPSKQQEIESFFVSNLCRSMVQKDEVSKFFCS